MNTPEISRRNLLKAAGVASVSLMVTGVVSSIVTSIGESERRDQEARNNAEFYLVRDLADANLLQEIEGKYVRSKAHLRQIYEDISYESIMGLPSIKGTKDCVRQVTKVALTGFPSATSEQTPLYLRQRAEWFSITGYMNFLQSDKHVAPTDPSDDIDILGKVVSGDLKIGDSKHHKGYFVDLITPQPIRLG